jgi:hypothetical protein
MLNEQRQRREAERVMRSKFSDLFSGHERDADGRMRKRHYEGFFQKILGTRFF